MHGLKPRSLAQVQGALQAFILGDGGDRARALPLLSEGPGPSRDRRLDIYHHAYRARLQEALGTVYERTWAYLGDEEFATVAARHIEAHPSSSRNLRDYGAEFPRVAREAFPEDPEVAELAMMDWNLHVAFDAPNAGRLDHARLAVLGEEDWAGARLVLHPGASLAVFEWNVLALWRAIDEGKTPPAAQRLARPTAHLFWRGELASRFRSLEAAEYSALCDLAAGASFASICQRIPPEIAGAWLRTWMADELLSDVLVPGTDSGADLSCGREAPGRGRDRR